MKGAKVQPLSSAPSMLHCSKVVVDRSMPTSCVPVMLHPVKTVPERSMRDMSNWSSATVDDIVVGDFDGNGEADVFTAYFR